VANLEHVALVSRGREALKQWREEHPRVGLDLRKADLRFAVLMTADLPKATLMGADLTGANLMGTVLISADLTGADLTKADLTFAVLISADLTAATLTGATLMGTNLWNTNFAETRFSGTVLAECDLSICKGLDTAIHEGPSHIATDTLLASIRGAGNVLTAELTTFFRGAGVPQELLAMLPRIVAEVQYDSCFISYGGPDRTTAERLYRDLQARGVTCWLYAFDATPGRRTQSEVKARLREADRTVVLCSADALIRDGVLIELEERIDDDPERLIPISLDNIWKHPGFRVMRGSRDLAPWLRERNYADFDKLGYDEGLRRLLKALERPTASGTAPA
jgi:uncharacterized protein YjbI with pentapeptide repeats